MRTIGGADAVAPDLAAPPALDIWMRRDKAPDQPAIARALLAHGSEGFLDPVALLPTRTPNSPGAAVSPPPPCSRVRR
ncbi:hypothetical protein [Nocardia acidivorans]|uniref:hypothetical protein n=1 Tax=Nocardia acidivorans TaxID=404580 RepID=UPI000A6BD480|nr:hypothetical protein [Nocardia acidivorans]